MGLFSGQFNLETSSFLPSFPELFGKLEMAQVLGNVLKAVYD